MTTHIIDDLHPEDIAMLQALYSRSPASVTEHIEKVKSSGSGAFMDKYYCGYGHQSIGDCGVTSIFEEGVSMLCAKAIQDWPLYSGQEASTRYMDFAKAKFSNPANTSQGHAIQERWRAFYLAAQGPVEAHVREQYPADHAEAAYERAIKARVFDVLRGFLPAGASTNLSWTTNLRQAADKLDGLRCHPHPAVRDAAWEIHARLRERYPHSFRRGEVRNDSYQAKAELAALLRVADMPWIVEAPEQVHVTTQGFAHRPDVDTLELLAKRPKGALVPRHLAELGNLQAEFALDFGSFRDLQRHRAGVVRMPKLTTDLGFHPWYLEQLPSAVRTEAQGLIAQQVEAIAALDLNPVVAQDYVAMGFRVPCRVTQPLPAYVYRLELRSSKTVHPTLRAVVLEEISQFRRLFPDVALHVDDTAGDWTVRRGTQTLTERTGSDEPAGPESEPTGLNAHEPLPQPSDHPAAWDLVLADIAERDRFGAEKYGQRLKPHDGRKNLVDIYQELMDAVVYVRKEIYEREGK